jgi:hypothetical protein
MPLTLIALQTWLAQLDAPPGARIEICGGSKATTDGYEISRVWVEDDGDGPLVILRTSRDEGVDLR